MRDRKGAFTEHASPEIQQKRLQRKTTSYKKNARPEPKNNIPAFTGGRHKCVTHVQHDVVSCNTRFYDYSQNWKCQLDLSALRMLESTEWCSESDWYFLNCCPC